MARSPTTARAVVRGYSLMTGWGEGLRSLPANARAAADGCRVLAVPTPACSDDRLRRATRECILAVAAVEQALANGMMTHSDLMGPRIALVYASAAAYAATNWAFLIGDRENALYFPYTAPSAVPGEVTIQFGITGPYLSFLSGANAGIEALWQAATLLINDQCDRALILGVDTFLECEDLYASGRWLLSAPLVEAATCLILERHAALTGVGYSAGSCNDELVIVDTLLDSQVPTAAYLCLPTSRDGYRTARRLRERWPDLSILSVSDRVGTCLACTPLIGLLLSRTEEKLDNVLLISRWWDTWSMLRWPVAVDPIDNNSRGKES